MTTTRSCSTYCTPISESGDWNGQNRVPHRQRANAGVQAERGLTLDHVVKVTIHLADLDRDFAAYDAAYRAFFADPKPARRTVGSTLAGILVEIDVVAYAG